jgi:hypothetical protein
MAREQDMKQTRKKHNAAFKAPQKKQRPGGLRLARLGI